MLLISVSCCWYCVCLHCLFCCLCCVLCLLMLCFVLVLLSPQEVLHNQGVCSVYLKQYDKVRTCEHAPITLCAILAF